MDLTPEEMKALGDICDALEGIEPKRATMLLLSVAADIFKDHVKEHPEDVKKALLAVAVRNATTTLAEFLNLDPGDLPKTQ